MFHPVRSASLFCLCVCMWLNLTLHQTVTQTCSCHPQSRGQRRPVTTLLSPLTLCCYWQEATHHYPNDDTQKHPKQTKIRRKYRQRTGADKWWLRGITFVWVCMLLLKKILHSAFDYWALEMLVSTFFIFRQSPLFQLTASFIFTWQWITVLYWQESK